MIKKRFDNKTCRVEFIVPATIAENVETVAIAGDFNHWDPKQTPMSKKGSIYRAVVHFPMNKEFEFRYVVNGDQWHTDLEADRTTANPYGGENSVVSTFPEPAAVS